MRLPTKDSAVWRALITAGQAMVGFVVGLVMTIWAVPGVPEAVLDYVGKHYMEIILMVGIPSGLASFVWNWFRKDVANY